MQGMSSSQIRHLFQDRMSGPGSQDLTAAMTVKRCLQGSTVIVTLTDPSKHNLWMANLGDSQAGVLGPNPVVTRFSNLLFSSCFPHTRGELVRNIRDSATRWQ